MTKYWHSNGDSTLRRYGHCNPPYQAIPDRHRHISEGIRRSTRSYTLPAQETQLPECDLDSERESKESRRRIPVACGRCRKRKIRCSGPQNDDSCVNCRNAGNAECQFNRVSSEELGFKSSLDFGYNAELARAVHTRGTSQSNSYRPPTPNYNYTSVPVSTNLPTLYRTSPNSEYPFEQKAPCLLPPLNSDYNDEGFDYAIPAVSFSHYSQESVGDLSSYSSYGPSRVWLSGAQSSRGPLSNMFSGSDACPYAPQQMHYNNQACGIRSSLNTDASLYSFSEMNSSLPTSAATHSHTRILPVLSLNRRNNSDLDSLNRAVGDLGYTINAINEVTGDHTAASQLMTEAQSGVLSYIPSSESSENIGSYNFNNITGTLHQPQPEIYDNNNGWLPEPVQSDPALHSSNSSSDLYQSECNDSSRKASQSSQSALMTRHNSVSDLYAYDSSDNSQKRSQSSYSTQSSLGNNMANEHSAASDTYHDQRHGISRKASQSGQIITAKTRATGRSYSGAHSQEKSMAPRTSSTSSTDVARTQRSHQ